VATFYADAFHGGIMANGKVFDMNDPTITAANAWPLGTKLRIRRIAGGPWDATLSPAERRRYFGKTITVTVADRGAFSHALDLSRGAFALLGRPDEGVIQVRIEVLTPEK
jgi:rare lipoprotein A (peptidoglycan hydrolase)